MKKIIIFIFITSLGIMFSLGTTHAQTQTGNTTEVKSAVDKQLDSRIEDLNKLSIRLGELKNIPQTEKNAMIAVISSLSSNLSSLRDQINTSASTTIIRTAREEVTKNYRIYGLLMPQFNIIAAADRLTTAIQMMLVVTSKIEVRLNNIATSSQITTANLASAQKTLSSLKDKLVESQKHAQLAVSTVTSLTPDQGDKTIRDSNLAALKSARAEIRQSYLNLYGARDDARTIAKLLAKETKPTPKPE